MIHHAHIGWTGLPIDKMKLQKITLRKKNVNIVNNVTHFLFFWYHLITQPYWSILTPSLYCCWLTSHLLTPIALLIMTTTQLYIWHFLSPTSVPSFTCKSNACIILWTLHHHVLPLSTIRLYRTSDLYYHKPERYVSESFLLALRIGNICRSEWDWPKMMYEL